jgi:hypothetical protein
MGHRLPPIGVVDPNDAEVRGVGRHLAPEAADYGSPKQQ